MALAWPIVVTLMLIGDKVPERWRKSLFISFNPRRCFYPEISIWFKSFKLSSRHGFHHPVNLMGVPIHQVPSWSWRPSPPSSNRHNSQKISSRHGLSWIPCPEMGPRNARLKKKDYDNKTVGFGNTNHFKRSSSFDGPTLCNLARTYSYLWFNHPLPLGSSSCCPPQHDNV